MAQKSESTVTQYKKILVGCDGSVNAERALDRAIQLAEQDEAALRILVAVNTVLPVFSTISQSLPDSAYEEILEDAKEGLARAISKAKQRVDDVSGVVKDGHAAEEIIKYAAESGVDLIVIGRRGISAVERFLIGGVSTSVVSHSKCDVLIVK